MKHHFVKILIVYGILLAASEKPAAKIFVTKNPTRKVYEILCSDLKPYDIVHVIDSSKSVGASGHIYAKSAAQLINIFYDELVGFAPDKSRAALIKFSTLALTKKVFPLTEYSSLPETNAAIADLEFDAGSATAIGEGLFKARSELAGNPSGNNKKVWLFTDGKNNAGRDPRGEADLFKGMGVQLCIVGIGNNINETALEGMASDLPSGAQCILKFGTALQYYRTLLDAVQMIKGAHGNLLKNLNMYVGKLEKLTNRKVKKVEKAAIRAARKAARKSAKGN